MSAKLGVAFAGPFTKSHISVAKAGGTTSKGNFITFDTLLSSSNPGWWSSSVNPERITVPQAGLYLISGYNDLGQTLISINAVELTYQFGPGQGSTVMLYLQANDYIRVKVETSAGSGNASAYTTTNKSQMLSVAYFGGDF